MVASNTFRHLPRNSLGRATLTSSLPYASLLHPSADGVRLRYPVAEPCLAAVHHDCSRWRDGHVQHTIQVSTHLSIDISILKVLPPLACCGSGAVDLPGATGSALPGGLCAHACIPTCTHGCMSACVHGCMSSVNRHAHIPMRTPRILREHRVNSRAVPVSVSMSIRISKLKLRIRISERV